MPSIELSGVLQAGNYSKSLFRFPHPRARPMMTLREILFAVTAVMTATFVLMVVGKIIF